MNLKTKLLVHQETAVNKLLPTKIGALFMEMGTGKSRTAIELVYRRSVKISNVIWFCPVSLKETIYQEILKHTDCCSSDICVFDNKTSIHNIPKVLWYIVGIESMSASNRVILTVNSIINNSSFVIVDESSYIKGYRSARTKWITDISAKATYRLILTGTPISQGVVDLYSQMRFLSPKILGYNSFYSFAANHLEYSEKYSGLIVRSLNTDYIAAKIKPYVYQVTKEECLTLPDKLYKTHYFSMTEEQRTMYETAKEELLMNLTDDEIDSITIFRLFGALQQIICGFWNRKIGNKIGFIELEHKRIDILINIIEQIPKNEKIIIWAKYRYDIKNIYNRLVNLYGNNCTNLFYGDLSIPQRNKSVDEFKNNSKFFLATPSCGGHGLTLNEANHVIFYNNCFKYANRLQAEDRCHRIGQTKKVVNIDVVCYNSIDERIQSSLFKKGNVVEDFKREVNKVKNKKYFIRSL